MTSTEGDGLATAPPRNPPTDSFHQRLMQKIADPAFQSTISKFPVLRRIAKVDGQRLFDIVAGFTYSQVLLAAVESELLNSLLIRPRHLTELCVMLKMSPDRTARFLRATAALGLTSQNRDGLFQIEKLGAAATGVPGLAEMIRHHRVLYDDLSDPLSFFRDKTDPLMAKFWPYVRGVENAPELTGAVAANYSQLMTETQKLVSEETLANASFKNSRSVLDVGGGSGVFLSKLHQKYPDLKLALLDLPEVLETAPATLLTAPVTRHGGSFFDPLPKVADHITLNRILFDHRDGDVQLLLKNVFEALPAGGRVTISEPMTGGSKPSKVGDVYYSLYTMAMRTGKTRSPGAIVDMLQGAGFQKTKFIQTARPYVTSLVLGKKV